MTMVIWIESYIYFRVVVLVKICLLWVYRVAIVIQLYLKKFDVCKVIDFIFAKNNLHLLEDYIYYNLHLCLLWIYEVTFIM